MFKAFTILALGAVASAQFLSRDLQSGTTLQQSLTTIPPNNVTAATPYTTPCTTTASANSDPCPGLYCCASIKKGSAAAST